MSLRSDVTALPKEMQLAGAAAVALALSLLLPWYQETVIDQGRLVQHNLSAFGVFTFIEAAILLVALAVLFLVWARSQRKGFHLPGGDGVAITLAGGWAALLLVWRLFDKPDAPDSRFPIGIQWGIFFALLAAGALIAAGARVRAVHRPEPPNPEADEVDWVAPPRRASAGRTGARATTPRSPRRCATAPPGRASRASPTTPRARGRHACRTRLPPTGRRRSACGRTTTRPID